MTRRKIDSPFSVRHFGKWFMLAFLSGIVNTGGYLACHRFVTHVTGFATLFGVELGQRRWASALGIITIPLYFLLGSMLAAFLVDRRLNLGKKPLYSAPMILVAACLVTAALAGHAGYFGPFGTPLEIGLDYFLLVVLCLASGLQNAVVTSVSGGIVRTTHLTGITTDLGLGIIRIFYPDQDQERHQKEVKANWLRLGTIVSFICGSAAGAFIFMEVSYLGFLVPAGIALYVAVAIL